MRSPIVSRFGGTNLFLNYGRLVKGMTRLNPWPRNSNQRIRARDPLIATPPTKSFPV